jgi:hypothetical protein
LELYFDGMTTEIVVTDEFAEWYEGLSLEEQLSVRRYVTMLEVAVATLPFPYSSGIQTSRFAAMRELREQHAGRPYRVLYAFDPVRNAVLLVGGEKTGDNRWCEAAIKLADKLWDEYLRNLQTPGRKDKP